MATVFSVDAHAAGEPCRVIVGGVPPLEGGSVGEMRAHFREHHDGLRAALTREPRGHRDMFGALLTPPASEGSAYGLVFFDTRGYLDGCGHGTLCSLAVQRRLGTRWSVPFAIDNPDDSVTRVTALEGSEGSVTATLTMPPARLVIPEIFLPDHEDADAFVAACGNTYLAVEAETAGLPGLRDVPAEDVRRASRQLRKAAFRTAGRRLPDDLEVALYERRPEGEEATYDTAIFFSESQIDRSPCGTGSSALAAGLMHRGLLSDGERIRTVGPAGEPFEVTARASTGDGEAYEIHLTGSAHVTGIHEWILGRDDPLAEGFLID